ncbi:MAG: recombinase family protein [Gemmatimonadetes bacterium]|nr:recombinase family protein [Gemmatimonadota bacterium]
MKKAVCYIRVGPMETRKHPFRRADQEKRLRSYCAENGLDIMLVILDLRVEAFIPLEERLGGRDLVNMVESKGIQHVVIWRLDRLFRSASETSRCLKAWSGEDVVCHVLDLDGLSVRTDGETGQVVLSTLTVLAGMAHDLPAERTKNAIRLKKTNRFAYGVTPYGYDLSGNQLVPNAREQEIIRQVRTWRAEGRSLRKIADELNEMGVPTKRASTLARETRWYASTVSYLLKNELYLAEEDESGQEKGQAGPT